MAALHYAVSKQEPGIVPLLFAAGAPIDQKLTTKKYKPHTEMRGMHIAGCSPLHLAGFLPSGRVVSELLDAKSNIAMPMATYTPLHVAAAFNNIGPVKELLKGGADPNAEDGMGNTPLHLAAVHGSNDVVLPLVKGLSFFIIIIIIIIIIVIFSPSSLITYYYIFFKMGLTLSFPLTLFAFF